MCFPKPYVISGAYVLSERICFPIFGYILSDFRLSQKYYKIISEYIISYLYLYNQ